MPPCGIKRAVASALRKTVTTFDAFSGEKRTCIICRTMNNVRRNTAVNRALRSALIPGRRIPAYLYGRRDLFYVRLTLLAIPPFRKQKSTAFSIRCSSRSKCQVKALLHGTMNNVRRNTAVDGTLRPAMGRTG